MLHFANNYHLHWE